MAYEAASLNDRKAYAVTLSEAGDLIPKGLRDNATGKPNAAKILLVMETGSMLGLHPMAALQTIDVVEGRATLSAKLQKTLITNAGHKVEIIKSGSIPGGDYEVTVRATRADNGDFHTSTWDIHRAIRAGLVDSYQQNAAGVWEVRARSKGGSALPWESYAENMPVWRAISDVAREGFGDVIFGLYSTEEMTDALPVTEVKEPSKDWAKLIEDAKTTAQLEEIKLELRATGEGTDELRTAFLAREGEIKREEATVEAEIVEDEPAEPEPTVEQPAESAPATVENPEPTESPAPRREVTIEESDEATREEQRAEPGRREMTEEEYESWSAANAAAIATGELP